MLEFNLFSGGKIRIDTSICSRCRTKACIKNCRSSKSGPVLVIKDGIPATDYSKDELRKGACTECLACELDCQLYGKEAIKITLPLE